MKLVIIVAIVVLLGAIWYRTAAMQSNSPTPTPRPENTFLKASPASTQSWETVENTEFGFTIKHPAALNDICCEIDGPMNGSPKKIIVLADVPVSETLDPEKKFDGVAIHVVTMDTGQSFEQYVDAEKTSLITQCQAFTDIGASCTTDDDKETDVTVNGNSGVLLEGYSWANIDRVYFPLGDGLHVLVFSKTEASGQSFDSAFKAIIDSLTISK